MALQYFSFLLLLFCGRCLADLSLSDSEDDYLGQIIVVGGDAYRFNKEGVAQNYQGASEICERFGWQLLRIDSESKNLLITTVIEVASMETNEFWMAANNLEDNETWKQPDGTELTYFNWSEGQPDNEGGDEHCIDVNENGEWSDKPCDAEKGFICEVVQDEDAQFSYGPQS